MPNLSPLASVSATRAVLDAHGLATKKALGQNFLINDGILQKIVDLAGLEPHDRVLEVGPGIGTLTIALLKHVAHVTSVERDTDLPAVLAETCEPWADRFTLVQKDALALSVEDLAGEAGAAELPTKFVANLPYAVAATLVLDYFERFGSIQSATVMVQKEVADRMMARPGSKSYGAYTVKLSLYAQPAGRFAVSPHNFFPPPHVESAVLRLDRYELCDAEGRPLNRSELKAAATMADAAFASRRKTLSNSCKAYFASKGSEGMPVIEKLPRLFERAGIDPRVRGESLMTDDFVRMGQQLLALQGS